MCYYYYKWQDQGDTITRNGAGVLLRNKCCTSIVTKTDIQSSVKDTLGSSVFIYYLNAMYNEEF